eukprot:1094301-Alexandrium_andersonii.AAC.1
MRAPGPLGEILGQVARACQVAKQQQVAVPKRTARWTARLTAQVDERVGAERLAEEAGALALAGAAGRRRGHGR